MLRTLFGVLFKVLLALGAVFTVVALLRYLEEQQGDYIEIYDNNGWEDDYY